jgi:hypothetical protein
MEITQFCADAASDSREKSGGEYTPPMTKIFGPRARLIGPKTTWVASTIAGPGVAGESSSISRGNLGDEGNTQIETDALASLVDGPTKFQSKESFHQALVIGLEGRGELLTDGSNVDGAFDGGQIMSDRGWQIGV